MSCPPLIVLDIRRVGFGDEVMGRGGKLVEALKAIGR